MCDISQEVKDELRKFRFARNKESSALICKFDMERKSYHVLTYLIIFKTDFSES